jgi:protein O-mannosyl-transferase
MNENPDVSAVSRASILKSTISGGGVFRKGFNRCWWVLVFALVSAVYAPIYRAGFVWDDSGHVTPASLRSWEGLGRIWTDIGAAQQYYPLLHSFFWVQHQLWGDHPMGYHIVNVLLHASVACLFLLLLRQLGVAGAMAAGLIFALHPVHVESVAWISEQKNTLSALFYLSAAWAYLRFDDERRTTFYAAATGCFILALLSKTVVATLPAALLVIAWWRRGQLSWYRDVIPLLPWLFLAVAGGLFTAWVERTHIGAEGETFALAVGERLVLAGRAAWFYFGKLIWPSELMFNYPRWEIDAASVVAWMPFFASLLFLVLMWSCRRHSRGPLAAALLYGGTLFPVLGFFSIYPFRYSYVADHFQYHASLAPIAFLTALLSRWMKDKWWIQVPAVVITAAALGALSWRQSYDYKDAETLFRATFARNPESWMAANNVGYEVMLDERRIEEAVTWFRRALALRPNDAESSNNLGYALLKLGQPEEALVHLENAVRNDPGLGPARVNLATVLAKRGDDFLASGRLADGIREHERALFVYSDLGYSHAPLARAYLTEGRWIDAEKQARAALLLAPDDVTLWYTLARCLMHQDRAAESLEACEAGLRLKPDDLALHLGRGVILMRLARFEEALSTYARALELQPTSPEAHFARGNALVTLERWREAASSYEEALRLKPDFPAARQNLERVRGRL